MRLYKFLLLLSVLLLPKTHFGQAMFELPDSLKIMDTIFSFSFQEPEFQPVEDSVSAYMAQVFGPAQSTSFNHIDLGNKGSESMYSRFFLNRSKGFLLGYDAFDLYRWNSDQLTFYNTNVAYSKVAAALGTSFANSSSSLQQNAQAEAFYTRNFAHNVNVSLEYRNVNELGMYTRDQTKHTQVKLQINQFNDSETFWWYTSWIRNAFNRQSNGGVENLDQLTDSLYQVRENLDINFEDGGVRDASNSFDLGWRWKLNRGVRSDFSLANKSSYEYRYYKFYLQDENDLSSFYQDLSFEGEGLRNAFELRQLKNDASLSWSSGILSDIRAGYLFTSTNIDQDATSESLQHGTLYGRIAFDYRDRISFLINGSLETLEDASDFDLSGELSLEWKNVGVLKAETALGIQTPRWQLNNLNLNGEVAWDPNLPAYNYFLLGGKLDIDRLGLAFSFRQYILDQFAYIDTNFEPTTAEDVTAISEVGVYTQHRLGKFYFKNQFILQAQDLNIAPLPNWQGRLTWFYQGRMRRNGMIYRLGIDASIMDMSDQIRFSAINGTFLPTDMPIANEGLIYQVDPYAQFDISTFSIFIKGENIQSLWWDQPFIEVVDRPYFDWMLRIGIQWRFLK